MSDDQAAHYEAKYGINRKDLIEDYVTLQKGLRQINRERSVPYRVLRLLAVSYGVLRSVGAAVRLQNSKMEEVFMAKYGVSNPSKLESVKIKIQTNRNKDSARASCAATNLERYGVANVFQLPEVKRRIREKLDTPEAKEKLSAALRRVNADPALVAARSTKSRATHLRRHGAENPFQASGMLALSNAPDTKAKRRLSHEKAGRWIPVEQSPAFSQYRRTIMRQARKDRRRLLAVHDGRCFYTGVRLVTAMEFLATNPGGDLRSNPLLPVVDHKTSIVFGFLNQLPISEMTCPDNLCVCSQEANCVKNHRNASEFEISEYVQNHKNNAYS